MAEEKVSLRIDVSAPGGEKTIGELKNEFKSLQEQIKNTTVGSEEYLKAIHRLGEVRGDLKDLKEDMNALNPENRVQPWLNLTSTIANGFAAAQGAMALFGSESEAVQQSILKVQAAMAIGSGIQNIVQLGDTFRVLKAQIMASEIAQKALNFVMNANPIGLLVAGVTALAGAIAVLTKNVKEEKDEWEKNSEAIKEAREERSKLKETLADLAITLEKEKGILSSADAEIIRLIEEKNAKKIELEKKLKEEEKKINDEFADKLKLAKIENDNEEVLRIIRIKDKRKAAIQKALQEEFDLIKSATEAQIQIIESIEKRDDRKKAEEDYLKWRKERGFEELEFIQSKGFEVIDIEKKKFEELTLIGDKFVYESGVRAAEQAEVETTTLQQKAELAISIASALTNAIALMGAEGVETQKSIALAQIAISTAEAFSGLTAISFSPTHLDNLTNPLSPYIKLATGAGVIFANMARAKDILSAKTPSIGGINTSFSGGGRYSGVGGGAPRPISQTNQPTTDLSGFKEKASATNTVGERPIRAYVVESEITTSQKAVSSIQRKSIFG